MTCYECIHRPVCKHTIQLTEHFPFTSDDHIRKYLEAIVTAQAESCLQYLSVDNIMAQIETGYVLGKYISKPLL